MRRVVYRCATTAAQYFWRLLLLWLFVTCCCEFYFVTFLNYATETCSKSFSVMVATPNFGEIFCMSSRERETRIWQKRVVGLKMNDSGLFQGKNVFVTIPLTLFWSSFRLDITSMLKTFPRRNLSSVRSAMGPVAPVPHNFPYCKIAIFNILSELKQKFPPLRLRNTVKDR